MKLETRLTRLLGKEKVFTSLPMWEMYAYDSSPFISKPDMVVFVSCTDDVSHVMGLAYEYGVPVLARGAGTCLSGGAIPVKAGISLVMARMNAILSIDPVSRTALVEPGIVNLTLQKALAPHNLIFPPDPVPPRRCHHWRQRVGMRRRHSGRKIRGDQELCSGSGTLSGLYMVE